MPLEKIIGEPAVKRQIDQILVDNVGASRRDLLVGILIRAKAMGARVLLVGGVAETVEGDGVDLDKLAIMNQIRGDVPNPDKPIMDVDIFVVCPLNKFDEVLVDTEGGDHTGWDMDRTVDHASIRMFNDKDGRAFEAKWMAEGDVIDQLSKEGYCSLLAVGQVEVVGGEILYRRVWPDGFVDNYDVGDNRVDGEIGEENRMGPIVALRLGLKAMTDFLLLRDEKKRQLGVDEQTVIDLLKKRMKGFGGFKFPSGDYAFTPKGSALVRWGLYLIERMTDCLAIDRDTTERLIRLSGLEGLYWGMNGEGNPSTNMVCYLEGYVGGHSKGSSKDLARRLLERLRLVADIE